MTRGATARNPGGRISAAAAPPHPAAMERCTDRTVYPNYTPCCASAAVLPAATGRVIAAPNNSGKSTFAWGSPVWLDQDVLLKRGIGLGRGGGRDGMAEADMRAADRATRRHVQAGHCVLVATWWDPAIVDAFVIVGAEELARRGLTRGQLAAAAEQAGRYRAMAREHRIPVYSSFGAASRALLPRGAG